MKNLSAQYLSYTLHWLNVSNIKWLRKNVSNYRKHKRLANMQCICVCSGERTMQIFYTCKIATMMYINSTSEWQVLKLHQSIWLCKQWLKWLHTMWKWLLSDKPTENYYTPQLNYLVTALIIRISSKSRRLYSVKKALFNLLYTTCPAQNSIQIESWLASEHIGAFSS